MRGNERGKGRETMKKRWKDHGSAQERIKRKKKEKERKKDR